MIVNSPRIFGKKGKFFTFKSKVLKRRKYSLHRGLKNSPLVVVVVLILIPAVLFGAYYLLNSLLIKSRFVMEEIIVEGNRIVPTEMILKAAKVQNGDNLFRLNIYKAKQRIEQIPQVLSASVQRKLPDTIIIQVVERKARAVIKSGSSVCIDSEGMLLPESASGGIDDITRINGIKLKNTKSGSICDNKDVLTALNILRLHDCSKLREQVTIEAVYVNEDGEFRLSAREKGPMRRLFTVYLGKEEFPQRMANLIVILERELKLSGRQDRTIYLTYDRPPAASSSSRQGS